MAAVLSRLRFVRAAEEDTFLTGGTHNVTCGPSVSQAPMEIAMAVNE